MFNFIKGKITLLATDVDGTTHRVVIGGNLFNLEEGNSRKGEGIYIGSSNHIVIRFDEPKPPEVDYFDENYYSYVQIVNSTLRHRDVE